jgi:hypothetical protein
MADKWQVSCRHEHRLKGYFRCLRARKPSGSNSTCVVLSERMFQFMDDQAISIDTQSFNGDWPPRHE